MEVLGIDVGATGIKGSIVDLSTGTLIGEKVKMKTPSPATPDSITSSIKQMIDVLQWTDKPVGIGFPSIVKEGVCWSASNIDTEFIGFPIQDHLEKVLNTKVKVVNDADAAGIAEMTFGLSLIHIYFVEENKVFDLESVVKGGVKNEQPKDKIKDIHDALVLGLSLIHI